MAKKHPLLPDNLKSIGKFIVFVIMCVLLIALIKTFEETLTMMKEKYSFTDYWLDQLTDEENLMMTTQTLLGLGVTAVIIIWAYSWIRKKCERYNESRGKNYPLSHYSRSPYSRPQFTFHIHVQCNHQGCQENNVATIEIPYPHKEKQLVYITSNSTGDENGNE